MLCRRNSIYALFHFFCLLASQAIFRHRKKWAFILEIWVRADSPVSFPLIMRIKEVNWAMVLIPWNNSAHLCSIWKLPVSEKHIFHVGTHFLQERLGGYTFSHSVPGQDCVCQCLEILEILCGCFWCNIFMYKSWCHRRKYLCFFQF